MKWEAGVRVSRGQYQSSRIRGKRSHCDRSAGNHLVSMPWWYWSLIEKSPSFSSIHCSTSECASFRFSVQFLGTMQSERLPIPRLLSQFFPWYETSLQGRRPTMVRRDVGVEWQCGLQYTGYFCSSLVEECWELLFCHFGYSSSGLFLKYNYIIATTSTLMAYCSAASRNW